MAVAKSIKKPTTKVGRKTSGAKAKLKKAGKKSVKARATKTTKPALKPTKTKRVAPKSKLRVLAKKSIASRSAKASSIKKMVSPNKVMDFAAGILKQATKAQKMANAQCKALSKQASSLDKQCAQLSKRQSSAKGRGLHAIDKLLSKLQAQSAVIGASLLKAENNKDKIASLVDFVSELNSSAAPSKA
jgi:hypothetical protein